MLPWSVASSISGWLSSNSMVESARHGVSVGPDVYDQLDTFITSTPSDLSGAYEQAVYLLALAVRRAARNKEPAQGFLLKAMEQTAAEGDAVVAQQGFVCSALGVWCPTSGGASVLSNAARLVEQSGLNTDDAYQIASILDNSAWEYKLRQAAPVVALGVAASAAAAWWWWHHQSTQTRDMR